MIAAVVSPQVVLKVARIPMGNLNFGRSSSHVHTCVCVRERVWICWSKAVRSPMRRNGLWEPISPGYGSRGITARRSFPPFPVLFAFARKRHHLRRKHRPRRGVSPSSFRSIARNPMKFQCGIPIKGPAGYGRMDLGARATDGTGDTRRE